MRRFATTILVTLAVLALGATLIVVILDRVSPKAVYSQQRCTASADSVSWSLTPEQSENAALIGTRPLSRGMPARAATIALATAYQESKIRNIDYGDRDSLGLFQQRPSQGWGSAEQVSDPVYATDAFYDVLARIDGYETLPVTVAAQKVQRSAFPDAYANHEPMGRAWASALNGYSGTNLECQLDPIPDSSIAGDNLTLVTARVERDLPGVTATAIGDRNIELDALQAAKEFNLTGKDAPRLALAMANWAVAVASPLGIESVQVGQASWSRADGTWVELDEPPADSTSVTIIVGGAEA
ncbi:cobalt transporter [Rarobacter faecitabidus]|uniref:Uncharacterized protein n=1 Tax=Rarobacter faecitabidus TaxID=13243 RepID=A0A542ZUJ9_RARFA|nr:hypothetical protein [Rarobacter faecitabidus]TQL64043.1 hypothetical protein FB461_0528 [Rarobacter faecitabidus]